MLCAIELAIQNEKSMKNYDSELPPAWYHSNMKQFNKDVMQIYDRNYTEDFSMIMLWTPKVR